MRRISKFLCLVLIASMIASCVTSGIMPGNTVQAEESNEVPTIPFDMDFESDTAGSVPDGWVENSGHNSEDEECSSMQVVNDGARLTHLSSLSPESVLVAAAQTLQTSCGRW